jgi:hypothetical protein
MNDSYTSSRSSHELAKEQIDSEKISNLDKKFLALPTVRSAIKNLDSDNQASEKKLLRSYEFRPTKVPFVIGEVFLYVGKTGEIILTCLLPLNPEPVNEIMEIRLLESPLEIYPEDLWGRGSVSVPAADQPNCNHQEIYELLLKYLHWVHRIFIQEGDANSGQSPTFSAADMEAVEDYLK